MNAIETTYRGYKFRSRLEARWAVLFDALGIDWHYEHEGYETPTGRYLPDFWLPNVRMRDGDRGVLFEVKPAGFGYGHEQLEYVALNLNVGAILATGFECDNSAWWEGLYEIAPYWDDGMMLYVCRCGTVKFEYSEGSYMDCPTCQRRGWQESVERVTAAYASARQYRFW